jgi:ribosomal protein S18 acetylase RimI-like enzyme
MNLAIDTARKQGFDGFRLMVSPGNTSAPALYSRAGFKTVGEADGYGMHWLCQELKL